MEINNKIISSIRILLCIILLGIWSLWIVNLPDLNKLKKLEEITKSQNNYNLNQTKTETDENLTASISSLSKKINQRISVGSKQTQNEIKANKKENVKSINKELPKLVNLEIMNTGNTAKTITAGQVKENINSNGQKIETAMSTNDLNINLPMFASATREVLLDVSENKNNNIKIDLRNKIVLEKNSLMPVSNRLIQMEVSNSEEEFDTSWLPKYIVQKKEVDEKINTISNSLEKITNQLELVGIINNNDGNNAAIIKDRSNNKIEILKKKDEFQGLRITEITNDEVRLINPAINKTFIMKLSKNN